MGNVLIVAGLMDIAWMFYSVYSGGEYSSSFNIFAVIAGVFLRRNSLTTARIVRFFAAFFFATFSGVVLVLAVQLPSDLVQAYFANTGSGRMAGWTLFFAATLGLLWWVHRSLAAAHVELAIQAAGLRVRPWHRPKSGFAVGLGLAIILAVSFAALQHSDSARQARERAQDQLGPEYEYFVSSLSTSWSSGSGARVEAIVLAYTESSIQEVEVAWRE